VIIWCSCAFLFEFWNWNGCSLVLAIPSCIATVFSVDTCPHCLPHHILCVLFLFLFLPSPVRTTSCVPWFLPALAFLRRACCVVPTCSCERIDILMPFSAPALPAYTLRLNCGSFGAYASKGWGTWFNGGA